MADEQTTGAKEPQGSSTPQNQAGALPGEKKAKIAVPKKPRTIILGVGFNAAGKQIIVYSITERVKAKSKVIVSGFHLNIFDRIMLRAANHWYAPVNLHRAYGDSEQVSFLMPNFNKLLQDGDAIWVQLVSNQNPKASGILNRYLIYTTKAEEEDAKGKEEKKKQKGAGVGKEEGPKTAGFANMAVAGVGGVISGIIKPIVGDAAKEDKKFEPKELKSAGPPSSSGEKKVGETDDDQDIFEDYNDQLKAEEVEELEGIYQTEESTAVSSTLDTGTKARTISQGSTITGKENIQQSGGTVQVSGGAGGFSASGSTTQTVSGQQTIGTSGTVTGQTQGKIFETVSSTVAGQQQTGASAILSQKQTTTVSARASGQQKAGVSETVSKEKQTAGISGKTLAQQQAGASGSATVKQETNISGSQTTEASVQGTQKTEAEAKEKISAQDVSQTERSLKSSVQAQGEKLVSEQIKTEKVKEAETSGIKQASQTVTKGAQYSRAGSTAGMGTMPQPQAKVSSTSSSAKPAFAAIQPKAEMPKEKGEGAEQKPEIQEPAKPETKPAEVLQAQEKKHDESETKPSKVLEKPESMPEEEEIEVPKEIQEEINRLKEGSAELQGKVGLAVPKGEGKKQPEQGEKGDGENLPKEPIGKEPKPEPEKPGLKKPLQYPEEGKEHGALGPTPKDSLREPSLGEKDRVPSGRPGGIDGAKAPLQDKPKEQEELDKETSPQTPPEESGQEPKTEEGEESEEQEWPEEQVEEDQQQEAEYLQARQDSAAKKLIETNKFKEAEIAANKAVNAALNKAALWVWGAIIPTFGLSILLGAIIGDFIWVFKDWALKKLVKSNPITNKLTGSNFKLKLSWSVKGHIIGMNAAVLALVGIIVVFVTAVFWGICNSWATYPVKKISGMDQVCQYLDNSKIGGALSSLKSGGSFQASYATPGSLISTAQWTNQINSNAQKYNIDACILRVVVQKESGGQANVIGCDCAYNGKPQYCPNNKQSNTYYSGFPFNWDQCSYGIGLMQWTIYEKKYATSPTDFRRWQNANTPSRTPFGTNFYTVSDFLNPDTSLDLTAQKFSRDLGANGGDVSKAFASYVGASTSQAAFVEDRMSLYNLCKSGSN